MKIKYEHELVTTRLGAMMREQRGPRSIQVAADEAGVPRATWHRLEGGAKPDIETFHKVAVWLHCRISEWPSLMNMEKL